MESLERIVDDPRVQVRKDGLNTRGECVVYWMRRSQRGRDNHALNIAIEAGNLLKKPVLVFFGLIPQAHHANLRHYTFLLQGLRDVARELRKRNVTFVLRRPERAHARAAAKVKAPFWTVDSDVIVPTKLFGKEHYAARTLRPKIRALLDEFLKRFQTPSPEWLGKTGEANLWP
jgi:deoxyribodipyrimidine photo-lyase